MGFGARVATGITEMNGGQITSSVGLKTAENTWGQPAEWCDYSGVTKEHRAGILLMADAANFRPSWWHNRVYGLVVANPFGREAMRQGDRSSVTVKQGEELRLRFGALVYSVAANRDIGYASVYRDFVAQNRPSEHAEIR